MKKREKSIAGTNSRSDSIRGISKLKKRGENSQLINKENMNNQLKLAEGYILEFQAYLTGVPEEKNGGSYGEVLFDEIIIKNFSRIEKRCIFSNESAKQYM